MKRYPPAGGLTREQRCGIYSLLKTCPPYKYSGRRAGHNKSVIAKVLGVQKSTISQEVKKNRGQRGYRHKQADAKAKDRRQGTVRPVIDGSTWIFIESLIKKDWLPEQIHGWLRVNMDMSVSHEWIYQYILQDKHNGGYLYTHLRCKRKRKKRYGSHDRRGQIKNRASIDQRPAVVEDRSRIGDWPARPHSFGAGGEADTIIGKAHKQAIVSLTERKSGLALLYKVDHHTKEITASVITQLLHYVSDKVHTITSDNGKEFAHHEVMAQALNCDFYFAHPYSS